MKSFAVFWCFLSLLFGQEAQWQRLYRSTNYYDCLEGDSQQSPLLFSDTWDYIGPISDTDAEQARTPLVPFMNQSDIYYQTVQSVDFNLTQLNLLPNASYFRIMSFDGDCSQSSGTELLYIAAEECMNTLLPYEWIAPLLDSASFPDTPSFFYQGSPYMKIKCGANDTCFLKFYSDSGCQVETADASLQEGPFPLDQCQNMNYFSLLFQVLKTDENAVLLPKQEIGGLSKELMAVSSEYFLFDAVDLAQLETATCLPMPYFVRKYVRYGSSNPAKPLCPADQNTRFDISQHFLPMSIIGFDVEPVTVVNEVDLYQKLDGSSDFLLNQDLYLLQWSVFDGPDCQQKWINSQSVLDIQSFQAAQCLQTDFGDLQISQETAQKWLMTFNCQAEAQYQQNLELVLGQCLNNQNQTAGNVTQRWQNGQSYQLQLLLKKPGQAATIVTSSTTNQQTMPTNTMTSYDNNMNGNGNETDVSNTISQQNNASSSYSDVKNGIIVAIVLCAVGVVGAAVYLKKRKERSNMIPLHSMGSNI